MVKILEIVSYFKFTKFEIRLAGKSKLLLANRNAHKTSQNFRLLDVRVSNPFWKIFLNYVQRLTDSRIVYNLSGQSPAEKWIKLSVISLENIGPNRFFRYYFPASKSGFQNF